MRVLDVLALTVGGAAGAACVGPTLEVGEPEEREVSDAGGLDAGADAADARVRPRDASFADRGDMRDEQWFCREERDCALVNTLRHHCNVFWGRCVQCYDDKQCQSGRCAESEGLCRKPDPSTSP